MIVRRPSLDADPAHVIDSRSTAPSALLCRSVSRCPCADRDSSALLTFHHLLAETWARQIRSGGVGICLCGGGSDGWFGQHRCVRAVGVTGSGSHSPGLYFWAGRAVPGGATHMGAPPPPVPSARAPESVLSLRAASRAGLSPAAPATAGIQGLRAGCWLDLVLSDPVVCLD